MIGARGNRPPRRCHIVEERQARSPKAPPVRFEELQSVTHVTAVRRSNREVTTVGECQLAPRVGTQTRVGQQSLDEAIERTLALLARGIL